MDFKYSTHIIKYTSKWRPCRIGARNSTAKNLCHTHESYTLFWSSIGLQISTLHTHIYPYIAIFACKTQGLLPGSGRPFLRLCHGTVHAEICMGNPENNKNYIDQSNWKLHYIRDQKAAGREPLWWLIILFPYKGGKAMSIPGFVCISYSF